MQDDFGPTGVAIVEVLVGVRCVVQMQLMRDDHRRFGLVVMDEFAQLRLYAFTLHWPDEVSTQSLPLWIRLAVKGHHLLPALLDVALGLIEAPFICP